MKDKELYTSILNNTLKKIQESISDNVLLTDIANLKEHYQALQNNLKSYFLKTSKLHLKDMDVNANADGSTDIEDDLDYISEIHSTLSYLQWLLIEHKKKLSEHKDTTAIRKDVFQITEYMKSIDKVEYIESTDMVKVVFNGYPTTFVFSNAYSRMLGNINLVVDDMVLDELSYTKSNLNKSYDKDMFYQVGPLLPLKTTEVYMSGFKDLSSFKVQYNFNNKLRFGKKYITTALDDSNSKYSPYKLDITDSTANFLNNLGLVNTILNGVMSVIAPDATRTFLSVLNNYISKDYTTLLDIERVDTFKLLLSNKKELAIVLKKFEEALSLFNLKEDYLEIYITLLLYLAHNPNDIGIYTETDKDIQDGHPHVSNGNARSVKVDEGCSLHLVSSNNTCMGMNQYVKHLADAIKDNKELLLTEGFSGMYEWITTYNMEDAYHTDVSPIVESGINALISILHTMRLPEIPELINKVAKMDWVDICNSFVNVVRNPKLLYSTLFICAPIYIDKSSDSLEGIDATSVYLDVASKDIPLRELNTEVIKGWDPHINIYGVLLLNNIASMVQELYKLIYVDMYTFYRNADIDSRNSNIVQSSFDHYIFKITGSLYEATKDATKEVPQIFRIPTGPYYVDIVQNKDILDKENTDVYKSVNSGDDNDSSNNSRGSDVRGSVSLNENFVKEEVDSTSTKSFANYVQSIITNDYVEFVGKDLDIQIDDLPNITDTTWINIQKAEICDDKVLKTLKQFIDFKYITTENLKDNNFLNTQTGFLTKFIKQLSANPMLTIPMLERSVEAVFNKIWVSLYSVYNMYLITMVPSEALYIEIGGNTNLTGTAYNGKAEPKNCKLIMESGYSFMEMYKYMNRATNSDLQAKKRSMNLRFLSESVFTESHLNTRRYLAASMIYYDTLHLLHGSIQNNDSIIQMNYVYAILFDILHVLHSSVKITVENNSNNEVEETGTRISSLDLVPEIIAKLLNPFGKLSKEQLDVIAVQLATYIDSLLNTSRLVTDPLDLTKQSDKLLDFPNITSLVNISKMLISLPNMADSSEEVDFYKEIYMGLEADIDKIIQWKKQQDIPWDSHLKIVLQEINKATIDTKLYTLDTSANVSLFKQLVSHILRADSYVQVNSNRFSLTANQQALLPTMLGEDTYKEEFDILIKRCILTNGVLFHTNITSFLLYNLTAHGMLNKDTPMENGNILSIGKGVLHVHYTNLEDVHNSPYKSLGYFKPLETLFSLVKRI